MQVSREIVESLKGESGIYDVALSYTKEKIEEFDLEYSVNTEEFEEKSEGNQLGHDQDVPKWYTHAEYYNNWQNHKKAHEDNCSEQEYYAFCGYSACCILGGEPDD